MSVSVPSDRETALMRAAREKFVFVAAEHLIKPEYGFTKPESNDRAALSAYAESIGSFLTRARNIGNKAASNGNGCVIKGTFEISLYNAMLPVEVEFHYYDDISRENCRSQFGADLLSAPRNDGVILCADNASDTAAATKYILRVYKI